MRTLKREGFVEGRDCRILVFRRFFLGPVGFRVEENYELHWGTSPKGNTIVVGRVVSLLAL